MSSVSLSPTPGLFYILSQPKSGLLEEYHNWYNTEHGPLRVKLDFVLNGYRYKSLDLDPPVFLATYDLSDINGLSHPEYTFLRANRSLREKNVIENKLTFVNRRTYEALSTRGRSDGPAPIMMAVAFVVKDNLVDEVHRWYEEEHTADLMKIPGWRRTRRFQLVEARDKKDGYTELLAVHDFDKDNGLDGPEHDLAKSRPWRTRIVDAVESRKNQRFEFFHEFHVNDYQTPTKASVCKDGPSCWHLDGPENGPVIAFSNSLITDHHIWDDTIAELKRLRPDYRYLVYNTRGYSVDPRRAVSIDLLADDLAALLDLLYIDKCFAVIGVSLGGITALNFAIRHPQRLERFVACDCNVVSTAANTNAWQERVRVADNSWDELADQTIKRWFTAETLQARAAQVSKTKEMILAANRDGFVKCVEALCDFDISEAVQGIQLPGLLLAGDKDGALPATLAAVSKLMVASSYVGVANTGHLPMVEDSHAFVQAIQPIFDRAGR